jgi:uncharacterized Zn-finger protein
MSGNGYLKFSNDRGIPEICIGVSEFECIGGSPPQDHPHVYINMGEADTILCPYCGTRFPFDSPAMLMRVFLGWLRGERKHCSMVAVPNCRI